MPTGVDELWSVAQRPFDVDASALSRAVETAAGQASLDYRTRLLVRDSIAALEAHWGCERFANWFGHSHRRHELTRIRASVQAADDVAFPYLARSIVDAIKPETVMQLLRELSQGVTRPTRLIIGGSIALLLEGYLARHTQDIDVVDELPAELRTQHELLDRLADRFKLRLTHFQSHYLPSGWEQRIRSVAVFDKLQVFTVDAYDVVVGKLFSNREKDRDDLRAVMPQFDRVALVRRLGDTTTAFRADPKLLAAAEKNWFIVFGEPLPQ
jgi:hypothetical protein